LEGSRVRPQVWLWMSGTDEPLEMPRRNRGRMCFCIALLMSPLGPTFDSILLICTDLPPSLSRCCGSPTTPCAPRLYPIPFPWHIFKSCALIHVITGHWVDFPSLWSLTTFTSEFTHWTSLEPAIVASHKQCMVAQCTVAQCASCTPQSMHCRS